MTGKLVQLTNNDDKVNIYIRLLILTHRFNKRLSVPPMHRAAL